MYSKFCVHFKFIFYVQAGDFKLRLLVSVYVSSSCIMAWWWPEFKVETDCHINKTICKGVGCDCENI
jgi:hypothetical protein